MMNIYDLIVIGGGPGGYLGAERAARAGLRTLLFEQRALGGVCLNEGCIPSKALLHSAKTYRHALHAARYGVKCENVAIDQRAVVERRGRVIRTLVGGVRAKLKGAGVEVVMERAEIAGREGEVFLVDAAGKRYGAKRLLIATGSSTLLPPIPGVRENLGAFVITSREALELAQIPNRFIVVGGGVIGLEMAAYYAGVGAQVTVVELTEHIAGSADREIAALLQRELEGRGVRFLLGCKCTRMEAGRAFVQQADGAELILPADKLLMCVGRRVNAEGLGLERIGVDFSRSGVVTDALGRTNIENVYAVGDVNGRHMLAHTAYREAEVAVNAMLGKPDSMRYNANPAVIYTDPELAFVGRTEEECREKGIEYEVQKLSMRHSGRFVAENDGADGLCKILIHKKRRNIIGVHLLGPCAGEIIWGAAEMIETQLRVQDARQIIFPHPSVSEVIRETLWAFED